MANKKVLRMGQMCYVRDKKHNFDIKHKKKINFKAMFLAFLARLQHCQQKRYN